MGNLNEVRRNFGKRATNYRTSSVHSNPDDLKRMISLLNPSKDQYALDIATGGGHTAVTLAKTCKQVVAIDITPQMLKEAFKLSNEKNITNLEFKSMDVHNLGFPDNIFDIVASRFAIHHFADVKKALHEMVRVLKPGGKIYVLDCSVYDGDESEIQFNKIELLRDSSHKFSYSPRLWDKMLNELHLSVEHTSLLTEKYALPSWFERMETTKENRDEIFKVLENISDDCKKHYPYSEEYISTYRYEILATKL